MLRFLGFFFHRPSVAAMHLGSSALRLVNFSSELDQDHLSLSPSDLHWGGVPKV